MAKDVKVYDVSIRNPFVIKKHVLSKKQAEKEWPWKRRWGIPIFALYVTFAFVGLIWGGVERTFWSITLRWIFALLICIVIIQKFDNLFYGKDKIKYKPSPMGMGEN